MDKFEGSEGLICLGHSSFDFFGHFVVKCNYLVQVDALVDKLYLCIVYYEWLCWSVGHDLGFPEVHCESCSFAVSFRSSSI